MGSLRIFLILVVIAMITGRVGAACLKIKLKSFINLYGTMQKRYNDYHGDNIAGRVGCCDAGIDRSFNTTQRSVYNGWVLHASGLPECRKQELHYMPDRCDHNIKVTPKIHGIVRNGTAWAGTEFPSRVNFGHWIGNINNDNIKACSILYRRYYRSGRHGWHERYMQDVDLSINVHDEDGIIDGDFVTHFKAKIHPMRFPMGSVKRLCLSAQYLGRQFVDTTSRPCHEAPYSIDIDFSWELSASELERINSTSLAITQGPFCETEPGSIYGCHA